MIVIFVFIVTHFFVVIIYNFCGPELPAFVINSFYGTDGQKLNALFLIAVALKN